MSEHLENQWVDLVRSARGLVDQSIRSGRKEMTKSAKKLQGQFETLDDIRSELGDCKRCKLHSDRNHIVFGVGNPKADLVIVGEAPGRDEDKQGEPFVGRAGKLLTDILSAIGLSRDDVYICNVIKCRPPQNRNPELDEIEQCEPFLKAQIASISPSIILTVGKFAAHALLQVETPISQLRGNFFEYEGIPMIPTYHPAYLLRNPSAKKIVWEDMKKLHAKLCTLTGKKLVLKGK
ncbi:MAG: uracil-DNA glycosylase [Bdellovibrionales bacterium]|nr:uracil-DNA glycosylase [Bdellovibrionales bacterium]